MCKMSGFIRDGCESEVNPFPKCGIDVVSCEDAALKVFTVYQSKTGRLF